jgi:hypothetical protein
VSNTAWAEPGTALTVEGPWRKPGPFIYFRHLAPMNPAAAAGRLYWLNGP